MNTTANIESDRIEPTVWALRQLSPGSQTAAEALVRQLAEGDGLKLRETSPRSPTPGLPGDARPKGLGRGCPTPLWLYGHAGAIPAPRLIRIAGHGEILYSIYKLYILDRQLLGRHADESCWFVPVEVL